MFLEKSSLSYEAQARLAAGTGKGIKLDEFPNGRGEFALEVTNPVPADGIPMSELYFRFLLTPEGERPQFKRVGSWETPLFPGPTDGYDLSDSKGTFLARIYINAYAGGTSEKAPKGFRYFRPFKNDPLLAKVGAEVAGVLRRDVEAKSAQVLQIAKALDALPRRSDNQAMPTFGPKAKLALLIFFVTMFVALMVLLIRSYGLSTILRSFLG